jgi:hypothetical protein
MRPVRIITVLLCAATVTTLTLLAAPASAAPITVHVSPSPVVAGHTVTLSGSVGPDGASSDCASIALYSLAFTTTNDMTMAPVSTTAKPDGTFTATARIPRFRSAGTYPISLRCGGATAGGGRLVVRAVAAPQPVNLQVSPSRVVAGHTVTVSGSVGPVPADSACASGVTLISKAVVHTDDFAGLPAVFATVKPDGTFTATTTIPRSKQAGSYSITGRCGGGNLGVSATLVVRAGPVTDPVSPTTTPAPAAPPATGPPIDQPLPAPTVTGPPNQPAATAAAQAASGWIIPGLAALGSGTLAALGVWRLYRRRYPAGPSRQGRSGMAH